MPQSLTRIERDIRGVLPHYITDRLPSRIHIARIDALNSAALNATYRKKHVPTNVLSFRYGPQYGEILLCESVIRMEAQCAKHSMRFQMTWIILHAMLHLAGMHHERSRVVAIRVERLEDRVMKRLCG